MDELTPLDRAAYNPLWEVWTRVARVPPEERHRCGARRGQGRAAGASRSTRIITHTHVLSSGGSQAAPPPYVQCRRGYAVAVRPTSSNRLAPPPPPPQRACPTKCSNSHLPSPRPLPHRPPRLLDLLPAGSLRSLWRASLGRYTLDAGRALQLFAAASVWDDFPREPGQVRREMQGRGLVPCGRAHAAHAHAVTARQLGCERRDRKSNPCQQAGWGVTPLGAGHPARHLKHGWRATTKTPCCAPSTVALHSTPYATFAHIKAVGTGCAALEQCGCGPCMAVSAGAEDLNRWHKTIDGQPRSVGALELGLMDTVLNKGDDIRLQERRPCRARLHRLRACT